MTLTCPHCNGTGTYTHLGSTTPCTTCGSTGRVEVDEHAIRAAITSQVGVNQGNLRVKKTPSMAQTYGAEYVWRTVRYLGKVDRNLPAMAFFSVGVTGVLSTSAESVLGALDAIAQQVTLECFGEVE